ncbi:MAG TPA: branched-chain amino acid transaminase [Anaerolineae bacterium]|nr:branched-chain amino acid transaminase [Anaerolineae bacterium]
MESQYTWMNGRLVPNSEANVPFMTNALHYGTAVFEGIRSYSTERGPAIFRLRDHMQRLINSARILGIRQFPYELDTLVDAAKETVRANHFADCYVRPLIYLASGGFNLNVDYATIGVGIGVWEWNQYMGPEALAKGIRANISSFTRHHVNVMMTKAKISGNYANSFLARTESMRLGFDEAIMLDPLGYVAECTGENLFVVRGGKIYTPSRTTVLEGITRDSLITVAHDLGYEVIEEPISRDQLYIADEVFVCGTAAEVIGLREIDFRTIGAGESGPITRHLQKTFHDVVRGKEPRYAEWLDPVTMQTLPEVETETETINAL